MPMTRVSSLAIVTVAVLALAACSEDPVRPTVDQSRSTDLAQLSVRGTGPEQVMPGEVIVKMKAGASPVALGRAYGLSLSIQGARGAFAVLRGPVGRERELAAQLRANPSVAYAEPNFLRQPTAIDSRLWAFYNPGGLNMQYTSGSKKGQFIPSSYAST